MTLEEILSQLQQGFLTQTEALYEIQKINSKIVVSDNYEVSESLNELQALREAYGIICFVLGNPLPPDTEKYKQYSKLSLFKVLKNVIQKIPLRGIGFKEYMTQLETLINSEKV